MLAGLAFHVLPGVTPGVGALASTLFGLLHGLLAMGIFRLLLLWGYWFWDGDVEVDGRSRTRGSVALESVVQQVFQTSDPCLRTGIALILIRRESEKRSGRAQSFL